MNDKKNKTLLAIFFLLDVALVGGYGYLFFAVKTKNQETASLYTLSHEQVSDQGKMQGLEKTLKETEEDRKKLSLYFSIKTNPVAFIEQIEKIGKSAGVVLSVSSVSDATKDNNGVISLAFSSTGSFSDTYRLLALVESLPYKVAIKKADIQSAQATGDEKKGSFDWKGNFAITLESFVPPKAATTSADKK